MIDALINLLKKFIHSRNRGIYIEFTISQDKSIDFKYNFNEGEEELFANLMYNLNSGGLFEDILNFMQKLAVQNKKDVSFQKMVAILKQMYVAEHRLLKELDKNMKEEPLVKPSEIFGKNRKHPAVEEDDESF